MKPDIRGYGNKTTIEYYLPISVAKELAMIENNEIGRRIRRYFIEAEKRLELIISNNASGDLIEIINVVLNYTEDKFEIIERRIEQINDKIESINIIIKKK